MRMQLVVFIEAKWDRSEEDESHVVYSSSSHDWIWRAEMSHVAAIDGAIEPRDIEPVRLL